MAQTVRGLALIDRRLRKIKREAFLALRDQISEEADAVLIRSRDLAPQLTGAMIAHSYTKVRASQSRGRITAEVIYDEPYALFQHEGYYNPGPVTRAKLGNQFAVGRKFLQRAVDERNDEVIRNCGRALERALRRALR